MIVRAILAAGIAIGATAAAQTAKPVELRFGNEPWHLAVALGDLKPYEGQPSTADRQIYSYENDRMVILTVIVQNMHEPATMDGCREVFERRKKMSVPGSVMVNEAQGQRGDALTQEFDAKLEFKGQPAIQHHIFSCRSRGNYFIDVHASKFGYVPADRATLMAVVDGVKVVD